MKPRPLMLLRIEDEIFNPAHDLVHSAPVQVLAPIAKWLEFCRAIADRKIDDFDLLTIDLNFNKDQTSPRFPPVTEGWDIDPEYATDEQLRRLGWSSRLQRSGKNSGLVIAATVVGAALFRDKPIGAAVHTAWPDMATRDVTSALLLAQILLASGVKLRTHDSRELLRDVIRNVHACERTCQDVLPDTVQRFRHAFERRAGLHGSRPSIWLDVDQLAALDDALESRTQQELDVKLETIGVMYWDRDGRLDSLSLSSLFLDVLAERDGDGLVKSFRQKLEIADLSRKSESGRIIHRFIDTLIQRSTANVTDAANFVRTPGGPVDTVNRELSHPMHRLYALLFAYCDQYAEAYIEYLQPWNSLEWAADPAGDCETLRSQLMSLLRLLAEGQQELPDGAWMQLSSVDGFSILKLVDEACEDGENALAQGLGYDAASPVSQANTLWSRRHSALKKMLDLLEEYGCIIADENRFHLVKTRLPARCSSRVDRSDLARRLGFRPGNEGHNLAAVIGGALPKQGLEFLDALDSRPLPPYLRRVCQRYMRDNWPDLAQTAWPPCLVEKEVETCESTGESAALVV